MLVSVDSQEVFCWKQVSWAHGEAHYKYDHTSSNAGWIEMDGLLVVARRVDGSNWGRLKRYL